MNTHQKYLRQQKTLKDKNQLIFTNKGLTKNTNPLTKMITTLNLEPLKYKIVFCPFCLAKANITKFLISTKKGISRRLAKCPECQKQFLIETIIRMLEWTPSDYAEWIYYYPAPEFWSKCTFNKFKTRLHHMNMSIEFWNAYKQIKNKNSDYEPESEPYTEQDEQQFIEKMKNRGIEIEN